MDIDVYNPDVYVDGVPHEQFTWLRDNAPVYWQNYTNGPMPRDDGFWVVSRHADVKAVSKDHKTFSAQKGFVVIEDLEPDILAQAQGQLLGMDPPNHGPIRKVVIERFTTRQLAAMEPMVRERAKEAIQRALEKPECNFVFDVVGHLPTAVICSVLDIPRDMWDQVRHWSDLQTSADDPDLGAGSMEATNAASLEMGMYGYTLATERKDKGGDDLISLLLNVEVEGRKVTEEEFASLFIQIAVAGNETTRGMISTGMYELIKHPESYRELEANPEGLPLAVEEMLRWSTPLHYFRRTATRDTEIAGQVIKEGDRVMMSYTGANFDDRVFDNPLKFDIHRQPNPHMGFGFGIHLCLGANLARMEARIFFEEFFKAFKGIEMTGEPRRIRSNLVNGFKDMPVRMTPR